MRNIDECKENKTYYLIILSVVSSITDIISIYYRLFAPILIIIISILITWLLRRIKWVKNIVPK